MPTHAMKTKGGMMDVMLTAVNILDEDSQSHPGMNPGNYLKLSIADTGCGIPTEHNRSSFRTLFHH